MKIADAPRETLQFSKAKTDTFEDFGVPGSRLLGGHDLLRAAGGRLSL